jgi:hypothetical protein
MRIKGAASIPRKKPRGGVDAVKTYWKNGAGEGIRTLDPNLGKVVLYP